jgi:hypothetical protein
MDRRTKILMDEFNSAIEDGREWDEDLRLAIAGNPDVAKIKNAMDENGKRMCLDLLEYMAKNDIKATWYEHEVLGVQYRFIYKGTSLTKEQLFENFL